MEEIFGPGGSPCEAPGGGFEGGGEAASAQNDGGSIAGGSPRSGGTGFEAPRSGGYAGAESARPASAGQRAGQSGGAGMTPAAAAAPGAGSGPDRTSPEAPADGGLPPRSGPTRSGLVAAMRADPELKTLALKAALASQQVADRQGDSNRDYLSEIRRLDPTVTSWKDVAGADTDRSFFRLVFGRGVDAVTAYKAVFFDRLLQGRAEAARQQALNEARAKSHLAPVGGGEGSAGEMSAAELEEWAAYGFGPAEARRYKNRFKKER